MKRYWKSLSNLQNKPGFLCDVLQLFFFFDATTSECQGILSHFWISVEDFTGWREGRFMVSDKVLLQCSKILFLVFFQTTSKLNPHKLCGLCLNKLTAFEMFWWQQLGLIFQKALTSIWLSLHYFPLTISWTHNYFSLISFHYWTTGIKGDISIYL